MELDIFNGQVWRQLGFPCFEFVVLMLAKVNGEITFCRVGTGLSPLVMPESSGKWFYTEKELQDLISECKYTLIGDSELVVRENDQIGDR